MVVVIVILIVSTSIWSCNSNLSCIQLHMGVVLT